LSGAAPLGVYIHWPYCARICPYCDFNVRRDRGRSDAGEALVDAIAEDLAGQAALLQASGEHELVSIYFGGGTPSLMRPEHVRRLVEAARRLWPAAGGVEVTLEANPTDAPRLAALADTGVNRLSLGVQSLDDAALRFLGRDHDAGLARAAVDQALRLFPRVSLDLIYALPGQTLEGWTAELGLAAGLGAEHISAYQLGVEPGTPFDRARRRGALRPTGEEEAARFYEHTVERLEALGFCAYEVSNFARSPAARSRHNLVYWRGEAYAGAGPGAHGRLPLAAGRTATEAERDVDAYRERVAATGLGWSRRETLTATEALEERVLLGLRVDEGVPSDVLDSLGRGSALAELVQGGWLALADGRVRATTGGRLVLDSVTGALLA
jgi:putative oxygen-independent coproporphyrinogen III oxidase